MRLSFTKSLSLLCAGAAALAIAGCRSAAAAKPTNAADQPIVVAVAIATEQPLERTAEAQGALFPREKATIAANVDGNVVKIFADFGDTAKPGQILMRIDPREYQLRLDSAQAAVDQATARMDNSEAKFERAEKLRDNHLISQQEYDQIASAMRVDDADVSSAEKTAAIASKRLDDTIIRAPFAGYVQKRMASLGEHVTMGTPLYEIIATDPIKLRTAIPERFVPLVRLGMPLQLTVEAQPGVTYTGKITRIAPALDEQSRTLLVEAEVPNPKGVLKPGYFAHVVADLGRDRALFVPESAILRYAGVARVFVVQEGVAHAREVKTGVVQGNQIEITEGLVAGDRVISSEVDRMADGIAVAAR